MTTHTAECAEASLSLYARSGGASGQAVQGQRQEVGDAYKGRQLPPQPSGQALA